MAALVSPMALYSAILDLGFGGTALTEGCYLCAVCRMALLHSTDMECGGTRCPALSSCVTARRCASGMEAADYLQVRHRPA
eukprot:3426504-Rhodomonas_salina.3